MRIAVIAPPWLPVPPPAYGGTESVIDRLVRAFHARGHDVLLCSTGDATAPVPRHDYYPEGQSDRIGNAVVELAHLADASPPRGWRGSTSSSTRRSWTSVGSASGP